MTKHDKAVVATVSLTVAAIIVWFVLFVEAESADPVLSTGSNSGTTQETTGDGNNIFVTAGDNSPVRIIIGVGDPDDPPPVSVETETAETTEKVEEGGVTESPEIKPQGLGTEAGDLTTRSNDPIDELLDTMDHILAPIMEDEAYREQPYELAGRNHVCYGHQLDSKETKTARECIELLQKDISWSLVAALSFVGEEHWASLGARRQGVVVSLAYILGEPGLMKFEGFQRAIRKNDWNRAGEELWDSKLPNPPAKGGIGKQRMLRIVERLL